MDDHEARQQPDISAIDENADPAGRDPEMLDLGAPASPRAGMTVYAADGSPIGTIAAVTASTLDLGNGAVPLALVAGCGEHGVQLAPRGDATFGAQA